MEWSNEVNRRMGVVEDWVFACALHPAWGRGMEDIGLIDAVHIREAAAHTERVRWALDNAENPDLLRILIDYYLTKGSKGALKILTTLKSSHAQDFFDKLQECIHVKATRLGVLRLLAFALNSQMSWLYKVSAHPLFTSILQYLRESRDIVVLTTSALVVAALIPLIPSYLGGYLGELLDTFYRLATIRSTHTFENVPTQLYPHLDVAVYYFFIQLYSLFPNNFVHSLQQKVQSQQHLHNFQEYIAPLFRHVQLHPYLITGVSLAFESSKERWCSLEPHDIATLSLSITLDPSLALKNTGGVEGEEVEREEVEREALLPDALRKPTSYSDEGPGLSHCVPEPGSSSRARNTAVVTPTVNTQPVLASDSPLCDSTKAASSVSGILTSSQLQEVCRRLHHGYDNTLGLSTRSGSSSVTMTTPASPPSEAANSDDHAGVAQARAYSPTASVCDAESLMSRQVPPTGSHAPVCHTSVGHTPGSQASACHTPGNQASAGHTPGSQGTLGHTPVEQGSSVASLERRTTYAVLTDGPGHSMEPSRLAVPLHGLHGSLRANIEKLFSGLLSGPKAAPSPTVTAAEVGKDCLGCDLYGVISEGLDDHQSHDGQSDQCRGSQGDQCRDDQDDITRDDLGDRSCNVHDDDLGTCQDAPSARHNAQIGHTEPFSADQEECRHVEADGEDTQSSGGVQSVEGRLGVVQGEGPSSKRDLQLSFQDKAAERTEVEGLPGSGTTAAHLPPPGESHVTVTRSSDCRLHYRHVLIGNSRGCPDPSPLELLNRLLARGEMVHRGTMNSIPLTEIEGMNWTHFGGCPHLEEVGIMQSQVVLLHSQLLFERYQCLQHARRSRHLLCKARVMDKAQEEVASLKEQVSCQKELIQSMQADSITRVKQLDAQCKKLEDTNRHLASVNASLTSKNTNLNSEVQRVEKMAAELSQELMKASSQVCTMKTRLHSLEAQGHSTRHLQGEVEHLSQDLLMLGEVHSQLCNSVTLRRKDTHAQQWDLEKSVLLREKESAQTSMLALMGELRGMQMHVQELQLKLDEKDRRIGTLLREAQVMQAQCHEKIKATESKYQTLVVTSQQLYAHIMELKGRPLPRKKPSHKRCKSQPTVS